MVPETFASLRPAGLAAGRAQFARAIRVEPKTTVTYAMPAAAGRRIVLRARLEMAADSRGSAVVRISAAGKDLFSRELEPRAKPAAVAVELPAGQTITIDVDFGARPGLPCAVIVGRTDVGRAIRTGE